ncbi:MAG TPA: hypothetical protein VNY05_27915 [Candidatus Acidoferrales bacterium]|jgi:hypothetical protein|nr:hypothetical protein [Candidatus Acidoferrales bacterium]
MSPCYLTPGQTVTVSGAAGTVPALVIEVSTPAILPDIPFAPDPQDLAELRKEYGAHVSDAEIVRLILEERGVRQLAFIAHPHDSELLCFATGATCRAVNWRSNPNTKGR